MTLELSGDGEMIDWLISLVKRAHRGTHQTVFLAIEVCFGESDLKDHRRQQRVAEQDRTKH